jgi:hypothetical protein
VLGKLDQDPCGTRVADGAPEADAGRVVNLRLRRAGRSKEARKGTVKVYGVDRTGRLQVVLGKGTFELPSGEDRTVSGVVLNRLGRAAVADRGRFVMRAIVSERGNAVSTRDIRVE